MIYMLKMDLFSKRMRSRKVPRCWLHLGTHKTGTTALQTSLSENRHHLRASGLLYPNYTPISKEVPKAHHLYFRRLGKPDSGMTAKQMHGLSKQWMRECQRGSLDLLLSAESLYFYPSPKQLKGGDWLGARIEFLQKVRETLADFELRPVLVLRRQDAFVESLYREWVLKNYDYGAYTFREFRRCVTPHYVNYTEQIEAIAQTLGPPEVLCYEALGSQNFTQTFLECLGVACSDIPATPRLRQSKRPLLIEVKRILNACAHPLASHQAFGQLLKEAAFLQWIAQLPEHRAQTLWESPQARAAYLSKFSAENVHLAKNHARLPDDFSACTQAQPAQSESLGQPLRADLKATLFQQLHAHGFDAKPPIATRHT